MHQSAFDVRGVNNKLPQQLRQMSCMGLCKLT